MTLDVLSSAGLGLEDCFAEIAWVFVAAMSIALKSENKSWVKIAHLKNKFLSYMSCQLFLGFIFVFALVAFIGRSRVVVKDVTRQISSSVENLWTFIARILNAAIYWIMHGLDVSLKILLVSLCFATYCTYERFVIGFVRVTIDRVTSKTFLQHDYFAHRTLNVDFNLRVNCLLMVLHVTASLEGFFTAIM